MSTDKKLTFSIEPLKTKNGLLKLLETILGAICFGTVATGRVPIQAVLAFDLFFLSITVSLSGTFLLLLSYLMSPGAAGTLSKSLYELLHHGLSFFFYAATSLSFLIKITKEHAEGYPRYEQEIASAVLGIVNSGLYFMSCFYSYKSFTA